MRAGVTGGPAEGFSRPGDFNSPVGKDREFLRNLLKSLSLVLIEQEALISVAVGRHSSDSVSVAKRRGPAALDSLWLATVVALLKVALIPYMFMATRS